MAPDATLTHSVAMPTKSAASQAATEDDAVLDHPFYSLISLPALAVAATVVGATAFAGGILVLASMGMFGNGFEINLGN